MKPVDQTIFGPIDGNCFAACIASILEVGIDTMPSTTGYKEHSDWWQIWYDYLRPRNMYLVNFAATPEWVPQGYSIAAIRSPRFEDNVLHACVAYDGIIVHDPHPKKDGLSLPPVEYTLLYFLDPSKKKENECP